MSAAGLFGPGSVTWRVYGETAMILGGGRALILQMAHPRIGAAVEQHSRYRDDRWGRLRHTLRTVGEILFGDTETAVRSAERMRRLHVRYRGVVPAGREAGASYHAADPALVLWVWATLVDTSLIVFQLFVGRLSAAEQERFYAEQRRFAELCGVPPEAVPPTLPAFRAYVEQVVRETLEATPAAREAAALALNPLGLPPAAAPLAALGGLPTAGLLPEPLRHELGVRWSPRRERVLRAFAVVVRRVRPSLPARARRVRSARAAAGRLRSGGGAGAVAMAAGPGADAQARRSCLQPPPR
ncbi:oxygenase MpaB family protein [Conexibacter arvalis]|uniref:Uncharacterized protein (DUF2236 family) n=1 Tax=Conexibacter arvalis TaxID=912552 RepID=A0A840IIJ0_9ACTN|nr:oxygenase MpaB family protein [Conexibacter arvalis]MBB4664586.1 uncharacterized protein (DUF2236 family) [Conexibacter arvalis]